MIEVEIKSLLGEAEFAEKLRKKLPAPISSSKQINHYFIVPSRKDFREKLIDFIEDKELFDKIIQSTDLAVRTRYNEKNTFLILKASIDDTTSTNGRTRHEIEQKFDLSINELDELLLSVGCEYQAKWSREREEFRRDNVAITIDKNAGYGYISEFEIMVDSEEKVPQAKEKIYSLLKEFDLEELAPERLERMFAYYIKHWDEYYNTEKTFVLE